MNIAEKKESVKVLLEKLVIGKEGDEILGASELNLGWWTVVSDLANLLNFRIDPDSDENFKPHISTDTNIHITADIINDLIEEAQAWIEIMGK